MNTDPLHKERHRTGKWYQLSAEQKRIYILHQLDQQTVIYNLYCTVNVEKPVNTEILQNALHQLIERHEALRTSITLYQEKPIRRLHTDVPFELTVSDNYQGNVQDNSLISTFGKPFDLGHAPLLRVHLIKTSSRKCILLLCVHSIIADEESLRLLVKDLFALYRNEPLPELSMHYEDYVVWQKTLAGSPNMKRQKKYWLDRFSGDLPVLNLPTDDTRPPLQSYESDNVVHNLDRDKTAQLKCTAQKCGVSFDQFLVALFYVLLYKYSEQEDIIIGMPFKNQRREGFEDVIGVFAHMLILRNRPKGDIPFQTWVSTVKQTICSAWMNREYPFDVLIDELKLNRDLSRNPLFDVLFDFDSCETLHNNGGDLLENTAVIRRNMSQYDLALRCHETNDGLSITYEYYTKIFAKKTILRMKDHFMKIMEAVIENPDQTLSEITILTDQERKTLLKKFIDTKVNYDRTATITHLFEKQAAGTPENVAILFRNSTLTYRELNTKANQMARRLRAKGVTTDTIVGIMVERSPEMIIGLMAILKAGGAYLPISSRFPPSRKNFIIKNSQTEFLLTTRALCREMPEAKHTIFLDDPGLYTGSAENLPPVFDPGHLAYVIYTSGSTGEPKGTMIEHSSLLNRLNWMQKKYPLSERDTLLQKTPFTFDVSVWELFWWAMAGARLCFLEPEGEKDPGCIINTVYQHRVTVIHFVPSMLGVFLDYMKTTGEQTALARLTSLRQVFASGEALQPGHVQEFNRLLNAAHGTRLTNLYGPTEATVDVSYYNCTPDKQAETIPIGKPIDNIQLFILNKNRQLQPIGLAGELCIAGAGLARGYLHQEALTRDKFIEGIDTSWSRVANVKRIYRTGDLARWRPNGDIEYLGRIDFQVKIRGFRIELGEIEYHLRQHPAIQEAVVMVRNEKKDDPYLCAYYVSRTKESVKELTSILKEYLMQNVPDYMVPSCFMKINTLPLTNNGKLDRKAFPTPVSEQRKEFIAPRSDMELKLTKIWKDILGVDGIGIHDDFFDMGGHSLKAIQLVSRLQKKGFAVSMNDIFVHSNISKLARYLTSVMRSQKVIDAPEQVQPFMKKMYRIRAELKTYTWNKNPNNQVHVMYYDETHISEPELRSIMETHLSGKIYPHYIFPLSKKPSAGLEGIWTREALLKHWGMKKLKNSKISHVEEEINQKLKSYENTILRHPVKTRFPLSAIQRGQLRLKFQLSGAVIPFRENIKLDILEQAFCHIVRRHGFLRSALIKENGSYHWQEHEGPDTVFIPLVDLTQYSVDQSLLNELINRISIVNLAEQDLLYKVVLLKINWRELYLVLPFHHTIHDQTCTEIIRRELSQYYEETRLKNEPEEVTHYMEYIRLLKQGPIGIDQDGVIEAFHLHEYQQIRRQVEKIFAGKGKKKTTYTVHKIHFKTEIEKEQSFQISYYLVNRFLHRYLGIDKIPMKILYNGRSYYNKCFYNTIGEFIDFVPVLVDAKKDCAFIIKELSEKIQFASKKNINFMSLFIDDTLRRQWKKVYECLRPDYVNWNDMTIVFNFLGMGESIEIERFVDLYDKANENTNDIIPDISSFYCEVLFTPEDLSLFIQFKLEEDMDKVRKILEAATAEALQHYSCSM